MDVSTVTAKEGSLSAAAVCGDDSGGVGEVEVVALGISLELEEARIVSSVC